MKNISASGISLKSTSHEKSESVSGLKKTDIKDINFTLEIFEGLTEGVFVVKDNEIVFANSTGLEIIGVQHQRDITGKRLVDIFSPHGYTKIEKLHNSIFKGDINKGKIKNIIIYTNGLSKIVNITSSKIFYNNKTAIISIISEVPVIDEKNERIRDHENIYRTIFETTGTLILLLEENSIISMVNGACKKICGYTREEIEGKMTWKDLVANEDVHRMEQYHDGRRVNQRHP
jgi:PAS domain-containing protein